jgi:hypothetical protein
MNPLDFTKLVQTRLGVSADGEPGSITLAALDKALPTAYGVSHYSSTFRRESR